jgi:hypothetical protein
MYLTNVVEQSFLHELIATKLFQKYSTFNGTRTFITD